MWSVALGRVSVWTKDFVRVLNISGTVFRLDVLSRLELGSLSEQDRQQGGNYEVRELAIIMTPFVFIALTLVDQRKQ